MKAITLILLIAMCCGSIYGQSPYLNVQISNQSSPEEPSICINPKNTNQVVAGANISSYYWSTNSGLNWTRGTLTSSYTVWGDPAITVDTSGYFYYFHLTNPGSLFIDRIVCQKSTNGGVTWSNGTYTGYNPPKQQDKAWGCVDCSNSPRRNWLYVTWTQFDHYGSSNPADSSNILFSRSTDGGNTWTTALRINQRAGNCVDSYNTDEGAVPCVGPNGELYVSWAGPLAFNSQFRIFFDRSTDGGNTWLASDIIAADQPGGWDFDVPGIYRANGLPITACDISNGPYRGTIYINFADQRNGTTDTDVWLVKSTNGGTTWSGPIRVNNDSPGRHQFFTWMAIDQVTAYIYIVFYDRRNYTDNQTDVYLARSTNGGTSFTNERISASPFTPSSGTFFGDYNNITAHNGKVRPMWTRLTGSGGTNLSVWTAIIDFPVGVETAGNEIASKFALEQNYPNPFNAETVIRYQLIVNGLVEMKIYDILGREVASLVNEWREPGNHEIHWDASGIASGVYYYLLNVSDGSGKNLFSQTKKMALSK